MDNLLQALPFYRDPRQLTACQCPGQGFDTPTFKLYAPTGYLPPFSLKLPIRGNAPDLTYAAECVQVLTCENVPVAMVSAHDLGMKLFKDPASYYLIYEGNAQIKLDMECGGCYRLKVDDYYSEVFWSTDHPEQKKKIEFGNSSQLGDVPYQTGLRQWLMVDADVCSLDPELFESRKTEANGQETVTYQRLTHRKLITIYDAPAFVNALLKAIPMHETVSVTHQNEPILGLKKRSSVKSSQVNCCYYEAELTLIIRDNELVGGNCQSESEVTLTSLPLVASDSACDTEGGWIKTGEVLCLPFGQEPPDIVTPPVGTPPVVDSCPPNGKLMGTTNTYAFCALSPWIDQNGDKYQRKRIRTFANGNCTTYEIIDYFDPCEVITPPVSTPPVGTPPVSTPPVGTPPPTSECSRVREMAYTYDHASDTLMIYVTETEDITPEEFGVLLTVEKLIAGEWESVLAQTGMDGSAERSFTHEQEIEDVTGGSYRVTLNVQLDEEEESDACILNITLTNGVDVPYTYLRKGECWDGPTILDVREITPEGLIVDFDGLHLYKMRLEIRDSNYQPVFVNGVRLYNTVEPSTSSIPYNFGGTLPPGTYHIGLGGMECIGTGYATFEIEDTSTPEACPVTLEMESLDGPVENTVTESGVTSVIVASGTHYKDYSITRETAGSYPIDFLTASVNSVNVLSLTVNGSTQIVPLKLSDDTGDYLWSDAVNVNLNAGVNSIRVAGQGGNAARIDKMRIGCRTVIEGALPTGCDRVLSFAYAYQYATRRLDFKALTDANEVLPLLTLERQVAGVWTTVLSDQIMAGTNVVPFNAYFIRTAIDPSAYRIKYRTFNSLQAGCTDPFTLPAADVSLTYTKGMAPPVGTPPVGTPPAGTPDDGIRSVTVDDKRYDYRGAQDVDFGFNATGVVDNGEYTISSGGNTFKAYYIIDGAAADSTAVSALQGAGYAIEPDYPYSFEKRWVLQSMAATQSDLDNQGGDLFFDTTKNLGSAQIIVHLTNLES